MSMNHSDAVLYQVADVLADTEDLEGLVRPLLEILETITGLESTYLTFIDTPSSTQRILYARNTSALEIPENLSVPWEDTLCMRALNEGRAYTDDVAACWGDSDAARALGITTYLSDPIYLADGELYGTLCGASSSKVSIGPDVFKLLRLFSRLIAHQLERERLMDLLEHQNREYSKHALLDPLTNIPNRRAFVNELTRMLARAAREAATVHIAYIDLDNFKAINDAHGHDAGDRFLIAMAKKLRSGLRESDLLARIGGDEFVLATMTGLGDESKERLELGRRLDELSSGNFDIDSTELYYPGASVGVISSSPGEKDVQALLARADETMYEVKRLRRQNQAH